MFSLYFSNENINRTFFSIGFIETGMRFESTAKGMSSGKLK